MMIVFLLSTLFLGMNSSARDLVNAHVTTEKHAKMKLLILVPKDQSDTIKEIVPVLQRDLSFSGQFDVDVQGVDVLRTKKDVKECACNGFPLVLWISECADNKYIEWRLYNTL